MSQNLNSMLASYVSQVQQQQLAVASGTMPDAVATSIGNTLPSKGQVSMLFNLQLTKDAASIEAVAAALSAATGNKLEPVVASIRRSKIGRYLTAVAAVMVPRAEVREYADRTKVPATMKAIAKNLYMDLTESKQYRVVATDKGMRLVRPSDLETDESIAAMLNARTGVMRAQASTDNRAARDAFVASKMNALTVGQLVSFVGPDRQMDIGMVLSATAACQNPDPGQVDVAVMSMTSVASKPVTVPAASLVDAVPVEHYASQLVKPASPMPAVAAGSGPVAEYMLQLKNLNPELWAKWLQLSKERGVEPMLFDN